MDRILIRDLHVRCVIGTNDWERTGKQDVLINIALSTDLGKAANSDDLEDTVNYRTLKQRIVEMVEKSRFKLVETLAGKIAETCLEDERVEQVTVTVDKPGALRFARSVAVEITRDRVG